MWNKNWEQVVWKIKGQNVCIKLFGKCMKEVSIWKAQLFQELAVMVNCEAAMSIIQRHQRPH